MSLTVPQQGGERVLSVHSPRRPWKCPAEPGLEIGGHSVIPEGSSAEADDGARIHLNNALARRMRNVDARPRSDREKRMS
jgi:hypothetical protein